MPSGELGRVAAVMRTALVGHPMLRFDAPALVGPIPRVGAMVEMVEARGKHLEVTWDDGLVLDTVLKAKSEWHVYRHDDPWRRSWDHLRASIQTEDFVAVCFAAVSVETYRQAEFSRHPIGGRLGPDIADPQADLAGVVTGLLHYPNTEARVRDALVDQHVVRGIGNVLRCEVLWGAEVSPWAYVADLTDGDAARIVAVAARLARSNRSPLRSSPDAGLAVYGRVGQACVRCHDTIESVPVGRTGRMLYWCQGCQTYLDRRPPPPRPMDPHPAAAKYLAGLRARRPSHGTL